MKSIDELKKIYEWVSPIDENGIASVSLNGKEFHVKDGEPMYEERFYAVCPFEDGIARAIILVDGETKMFHIDINGKALYEERFSYVGTFNGKGIAQVMDGGLTYQITKDGKKYINREGRRYA